MKIRDAIPADAPAACAVLRRSIVELCGADHGGDPEILRHWLANKTPQIVASWIAKPGNAATRCQSRCRPAAIGQIEKNKILAPV
ncbi:MAG TPA: hypothetical protein VJ770_01985 [Stellaceae bacterium]|nr:hypothetical protein [Stellaceae bacterium]